MMENTEIIKALRCESVINDEHPRCESCKYGVVVCHGSREDVYGCDSRRIENDAADALEAAEKRIAELEAQMPKRGEWIFTALERYKEYKVTCPFCGAEYHDCYDGYIDAEDMNYCPNCGAKMRGEHDEQADC